MHNPPTFTLVWALSLAIVGESLSRGARWVRSPLLSE
jgi:hypothetical protein